MCLCSDMFCVHLASDDKFIGNSYCERVLQLVVSDVTGRLPLLFEGTDESHYEILTMVAGLRNET